MKASLEIEDVGGLRGSRQYSLESGRLNIVESANAAGKTSVVRALASVLSVSKEAFSDDNVMKEAQKLGIRTDPRNPREGFVNVHSDQAAVQLGYDGKKERYAVKKNGNPVELPQFADSRFLLAGMMSNDSRILRQLHGLDEREADDFKWAVQELSSADRYERIAQFLKSRGEDVSESLLQSQRVVKQTKDLEKQKSDLGKKRMALDTKLAGLQRKYGDMGRALARRQGILNQLDELDGKINAQRGEISRILREELEIPRKDLNQALEKKKRLEKELADLGDMNQLRKEISAQQKEAESKLEDLTKRRNEIDGLLNLFVTAEAALREHKQDKHVKCILCEEGSLSYDKINKRLADYRHQREELNADIGDASEAIDRLRRKLEKEDERREDLRQAIKDLTTEIRNLSDAVANPEKQVRLIEATVNGYEETKKKLHGELELTKEKISKEWTDTEAERSKVSENIGKVNQQVGQLASVQVLSISVESSKAEAACNALLKVIEDSVSYAQTKAEEERQEAAKKFNDRVSSLLKSLGFTEFRNVRLNKDYRLYAERFNPRTNDYVAQQLKTLATSEKLVIALILQVALKETYLPNLPFFVIDDVIEDFDEDRRKKVIDYLVQKARDEDWFVVTTRLVEELGPPRIKYM
jgi:chromosome segregation ATPase